MKSILIFTVIAGVALAGAIVYLQNKALQSGKVINVEEQFAVDA